MPKKNNFDLLNFVSNAIVTINPEDIVVFWNHSAEKIFGWKENEAIGKKLATLAVPPDRVNEKTTIEGKVNAGKIIDGIKTVWLSKDGFPVNISLTAILERDEGQNIIGISYIICNNNEAKLDDGALTESELRLHAIMQSATDAFIIADKDGNIICASRIAQNIFQYMDEDLKGKPLTIFIPKRYRASHDIGLQRMIATGKAHIIGKKVKLFGIRKDGSEFPLELSLNAWNSDKNIFFSAMICEIEKKTENISQEGDRQKLLVNINKNTALLSTIKRTEEKNG